MGYHTEFRGSFKLDKPLATEQHKYLVKFNETRRMKRDTNILTSMKDPEREAVGLPLGKEGEFFVGGLGYMGQDHDESVLEHNYSPSTQPGLWCQWVPNKNGTEIEWDGGEKFYDYVDWLMYIIKNFLEPWGYTLNGEVDYQGEEPSDSGVIVVEDNAVNLRDRCF
jgi:hypothetical protein